MPLPPIPATEIALQWTTGGRLPKDPTVDHCLWIPEFRWAQECRDFSIYLDPPHARVLGAPSGRYDHSGEDAAGRWIYRFSST